MSLMMNFVTGRRKAITLLPVCRQCGFHFRPASLATARFLFRKGIGSCNGSLPTLCSSALVKTSSDRDSSATRKTIKAHLPKHDVTSKHQPSTMMGRERKRDKRQREREREKKRELIASLYLSEYRTRASLGIQLRKPVRVLSGRGRRLPTNGPIILLGRQDPSAATDGDKMSVDGAKVVAIYQLTTGYLRGPPGYGFSGACAAPRALVRP